MEGHWTRVGGLGWRSEMNCQRLSVSVLVAAVRRFPPEGQQVLVSS